MKENCIYCGSSLYFQQLEDHIKRCPRKIDVKINVPKNLNISKNINFEDVPYDVEEEIEKNPILKEVQDLLTTQTEKGLKKYPRTVNPDDYSITEWIDHVLQEKTDEIVYLVTLKHKIKQVIG